MHWQVTEVASDSKSASNLNSELTRPGQTGSIHHFKFTDHRKHHRNELAREPELKLEEHPSNRFGSRITALAVATAALFEIW